MLMFLFMFVFGVVCDCGRWNLMPQLQMNAQMILRIVVEASVRVIGMATGPETVLVPHHKPPWEGDWNIYGVVFWGI